MPVNNFLIHKLLRPCRHNQPNTNKLSLLIQSHVPFPTFFTKLHKYSFYGFIKGPSVFLIYFLSSYVCRYKNMGYNKGNMFSVKKINQSFSTISKKHLLFLDLMEHICMLFAIQPYRR